MCKDVFIRKTVSLDTNFILPNVVSGELMTGVMFGAGSADQLYFSSEIEDWEIESIEMTYGITPKAGGGFPNYHTLWFSLQFNLMSAAFSSKQFEPMRVVNTSQYFFASNIKVIQFTRDKQRIDFFGDNIVSKGVWLPVLQYTCETTGSAGTAGFQFRAWVHFNIKKHREKISFV